MCSFSWLLEQGAALLTDEFHCLYSVLQCCTRVKGTLKANDNLCSFERSVLENSQNINITCNSALVIEKLSSVQYAIYTTSRSFGYYK